MALALAKSDAHTAWVHTGAESASGSSGGLRVLRLLTRPNLGGPTRQCIALWHAVEALGHQTLLGVGACRGEPEIDLSAAGIPQLAWEDVCSGRATSGGWVRIPGLGRSIRLLADLRSRSRIRRLVAAWRPDVIHSHTSKAGWLARSGLGGSKGGHRTPVVHTFHGHVLRDHFGPGMSRVLTVVERAMARSTSVLTAVSPTCARELEGLGVAPAGAIRVIPPAVDLCGFLPEPEAAGHSGRIGDTEALREELGLPRGRPIVLWMGRMVGVKQPEWFARVMQLCPEFQGVAMGDGPLRSALERSAPPNLMVRPSAQDVRPWLRAADALVLTSAREGCPLVALEAAAAGVPVLGLDAPGVRDALVGWGLGEVLADMPSLAGRLRMLLGDPEGAAARGLLGQRNLRQRFEPGKVAGRYLELYREAVSAQPSAAGVDRAG